MDLLILLQNRGFSPRKISNNHGGEWCSPCPGPVCQGAGDDRFHVWPYREGGGKCVGRFWCRQCNISGDTIAFLQQVDGMGYAEACSALGIVSAPASSGRRSRYQPPPSMPRETAEVWQARTYPEPPARWQEKAGNLLADCQARLQSSPDALAWLANRGIDKTTAAIYGLGYNLSSKGKDRYRPRHIWGLPPKMQGSKEKRLWLPRGWVIPSRNLRGELMQLRIRRLGEDIASFASDIKYLPVDGSSMASMVLHPQAEVFVVVECGFDAILIASLFDGRIGAVTTWNSAARPDSHAHALLSRATLILGALDYDQGGDREQAWWQGQYRQYRRLAPLPGGAKDPGDAAQAGADIYAWVKDGVPRGVQIGLGLCSPRRPLPQREAEQAAAPAEPAAVSPERAQARGKDLDAGAAVIEVELTSGKVVYVTNDQAAWKELAAAGKPVFSEQELLRLQRALTGLDAEERTLAIQRTIEAKEVLGGFIVRGRSGQEGGHGQG